jgi:hypothetical protein
MVRVSCVITNAGAVQSLCTTRDELHCRRQPQVTPSAVCCQVTGLLLVTMVSCWLLQPSAPALLVHTANHAAAVLTEDASSSWLLLLLVPRAGHYKCEPSVIVGRPANREQLANLVKVRRMAEVGPGLDTHYSIVRRYNLRIYPCVDSMLFHAVFQQEHDSTVLQSKRAHSVLHGSCKVCCCFRDVRLPGWLLVTPGSS